jgi:hypothetical protein
MSAGRRRVSVVVAATDARATVGACLGRFAEEVAGRGEVLLVDASHDGTARLALATGVRVLRRAPGALAPELWRDGLEATDSPLVAFTTAAMVPAPGWLDALLARLEATGAAAVGGPIEPAAGLRAVDRAVYLLRYVNYLRPLPGAPGVEPPGDNALYRRDRLRWLEASWAGGFWEAEVHRALRRRGEGFAMADDAVVTFHGGARLGRVTRQRFRHALRYGRDRAARMGLAERVARTAATPAVPLVLLRRAVAALRTRGVAVGSWTPALPALAVLLTAWTAGEAAGLSRWASGARQA